ncbi:MAG: hypothetical protein WC457_00495 [Patescibacteria group bacterium]
MDEVKKPTLGTDDPEVLAALAAKKATTGKGGTSTKTVKDALPSAASSMSVRSNAVAGVILVGIVFVIVMGGFFVYSGVKSMRAEEFTPSSTTVAGLNKPSTPVTASSAVSMKLVMNNRCVSLYEGQTKGFLPTDVSCLNDKEFNGYLVRDIVNEDPKKLSLFCYGLFQADRAAGLECSGKQWGQIYSKLSPGTSFPYAAK